jgi:hypothetical protein
VNGQGNNLPVPTYNNNSGNNNSVERDGRKDNGPDAVTNGETNESEKSNLINSVLIWEKSMIRNLNPPDCVTYLTIFSRLNDYLFNQVGEARNITGRHGMAKEMRIRTLIDTGANLSFISVSLSDRIEKEFLGVRGIGNYKVTDAFLKAYYFKDNLSFRVRLNTGNPEIDARSWLIKAVIVDIDFTADFLLGLSDIKRIKLFRYLPECVEDNNYVDDLNNETDTDELFNPLVISTGLKPTRENQVSWSDDTNLNPNESYHVTLTPIRNIHWMGDERAIDLESKEGLQRPGIWGEEWTDEERIRRGK